MYQTKLTRIEGGEALRTKSVEGRTDGLPEIGKRFVMVGTPLESGSFRMVNTSPVVELEQPSDHLYILTTESGSKYQVEILVN